MECVIRTCAFSTLQSTKIRLIGPCTRNTDHQKTFHHFRSLLSYPGRTHYNRPAGDDIAEDGNDPESIRKNVNAHSYNINGNHHKPRRFSQKKSHNYYDGTRTPESPYYTENKASIMRRKTVAAPPPGPPAPRRKKRISSSMSELRNVGDSRAPRRSRSRRTSTPGAIGS